MTLLYIYIRLAYIFTFTFTSMIGIELYAIDGHR